MGRTFNHGGSMDSYTFQEAAGRLGIAESTLRKWVAQRRVPHHRLGRLVRFTDADIEAILRPVPPEPPAPPARPQGRYRARRPRA
jgi:excisionase family DNA binding protein